MARGWPGRLCASFACHLVPPRATFLFPHGVAGRPALLPCALRVGAGGAVGGAVGGQWGGSSHCRRFARDSYEVRREGGQRRSGVLGAAREGGRADRGPDCAPFAIRFASDESYNCSVPQFTCSQLRMKKCTEVPQNSARRGGSISGQRLPLLLPFILFHSSSRSSMLWVQRSQGAG